MPEPKYYNLQELCAIINEYWRVRGYDMNARVSMTDTGLFKKIISDSINGIPIRKLTGQAV